MTAPWSNAHTMPRSKRIYVVHLVAKTLGVHFHINGVPFGHREPLELLQQQSIGDVLNDGDVRDWGQP